MVIFSHYFLHFPTIPKNTIVDGIFFGALYYLGLTVNRFGRDYDKTYGRILLDDHPAGSFSWRSFKYVVFLAMWGQWENIEQCPRWKNRSVASNWSYQNHRCWDRMLIMKLTENTGDEYYNHYKYNSL